MKMLRSVFDQMWYDLHAEGKVGAIESDAYTRVLGEWRRRSYPLVTREWVVEQASK